MGDEKGFITKKRETAGYRPVDERIKDYKEVENRLPYEKVQEQGSRCMDCGVPFCHDACPVGNIIPDWNDLIYKGQFAEALAVLHSSNNFPEFTGRVCPALCEAACVVGDVGDPVTVRQNEISIIEWGFEHNIIKPFIQKKKTGKSIAVVGAGPAGMACAQQLTRAGHNVTLFEADDKVGGILRYGIPDFKLEKWVIDRRLKLMQEEGLKVQTGICVGKDIASSKLLKDYDAVCLTMGSREPRDIKIEGRQLKGVHFAMDYLIQSNRIVGGNKIQNEDIISAEGKNVVVIGGGDTGADCVGTANRQRANSIMQIEIMPKPPECRTKEMPWPEYPRLLKTSSSHEEGCERKWSVVTKSFIGDNGVVKKILCAEAGADLKEIPGTDFELNADLVLLAMGFVHPVHKGLVEDLGLNLDQRGNIQVDKNFTTSIPKVFSAGDSSRGASLVIWAISEGRAAAREIDKFLMGETNLPV
jgi:glutamate synthase (NADPH) small chain